MRLKIDDWETNDFEEVIFMTENQTKDKQAKKDIKTGTNVSSHKCEYTTQKRGTSPMNGKRGCGKGARLGSRRDPSPKPLRMPSPQPPSLLFCRKTF